MMLDCQISHTKATVSLSVTQDYNHPSSWSSGSTNLPLPWEWCPVRQFHILTCSLLQIQLQSQYKPQTRDVTNSEKIKVHYTNKCPFQLKIMKNSFLTHFFSMLSSFLFHLGLFHSYQFHYFLLKFYLFHLCLFHCCQFHSLLFQSSLPNSCASLPSLASPVPRRWEFNCGRKETERGLMEEAAEPFLMTTINPHASYLAWDCVDENKKQHMLLKYPSLGSRENGKGFRKNMTVKCKVGLFPAWGLYVPGWSEWPSDHQSDIVITCLFRD